MQHLIQIDRFIEAVETGDQLQPGLQLTRAIQILIDPRAFGMVHELNQGGYPVAHVGIETLFDHAACLRVAEGALRAGEEIIPALLHVTGRFAGLKVPLYGSTRVAGLQFLKGRMLPVDVELLQGGAVQVVPVHTRLDDDRVIRGGCIQLGFGRKGLDGLSLSQYEFTRRGYGGPRRDRLQDIIHGLERWYVAIHHQIRGHHAIHIVVGVGIDKTRQQGSARQVDPLGSAPAHLRNRSGFPHGNDLALTDGHRLRHRVRFVHREHLAVDQNHVRHYLHV